MGFLRLDFDRRLSLEFHGSKVTSDAGLLPRGNRMMRTLASPEEVEHRSLTTLPQNRAKIGAKIVRHGRCVNFQLAEVAGPAFSSSNQPDQEPTTAYREDSRPDS